MNSKGGCHLQYHGKIPWANEYHGWMPLTIPWVDKHHGCMNTMSVWNLQYHG